MSCAESEEAATSEMKKNVPIRIANFRTNAWLWQEPESALGASNHRWIRHLGRN